MSTEKIQRTKDLLATKLVQLLQSCKPENGFSRILEEQHTSLCYVDGLWALADNYNGAELVIVHEAPEDHAVVSDISGFQLNELMRYEKTIAQLISLGQLRKAVIERPHYTQQIKKTPRPQHHQNQAADVGNRPIGKALQPVRF